MKIKTEVAGYGPRPADTHALINVLVEFNGPSTPFGTRRRRLQTAHFIGSQNGKTPRPFETMFDARSAWAQRSFP
jgi:hypothetical protein